MMYVLMIVSTRNLIDWFTKTMQCRQNKKKLHNTVVVAIEVGK